MQRRYPSIETIEDRLRVDRLTAALIRGLMDGTIDPETSKAVQAWLRQCLHRPDDIALRMRAIDEAFETHGVEAIWAGGKLHATYCNAGHTYRDTVLYCHIRGRFRIGSYGTYVESNKL
jgi:hypothetical protein